MRNSELPSSQTRLKGLCSILWFMLGGGECDVNIVVGNKLATVTTTTILFVATPQDSCSVLSSESGSIEQDLEGFRHMDLANESMVSVEENPVTDEIPLFTEGVTPAPSQPITSVHSDVLEKVTVTAIPTSTVSTTTVPCASFTSTTSTVTGAITSTGFADTVSKSRPLSAPPGLEKPMQALTLGSLSVKPKVKDL